LSVNDVLDDADLAALPGALLDVELLLLQR